MILHYCVPCLAIAFGAQLAEAWGRTSTIVADDGKACARCGVKAPTAKFGAPPPTFLAKSSPDEDNPFLARAEPVRPLGKVAPCPPCPVCGRALVALDERRLVCLGCPSVPRAKRPDAPPGVAVVFFGGGA